MTGFSCFYLLENAAMAHVDSVIRTLYPTEMSPKRAKRNPREIRLLFKT